MKKGNAIALLPIGVFLVMYLGLGLLFEYGLKIPMGFYNIPIVIAFLCAILVACLQNKALSFDEKLTIMGQGVGDKNIITMLLIFLVAGAFVGVVGRSSAQSVAYFMLDLMSVTEAGMLTVFSAVQPLKAELLMRGMPFSMLTVVRVLATRTSSPCF